MAKVPRERFLAGQQRADAYADRAVPIDCGQTISQPYIVRLMTQALRMTGSETVLEVGTGSGYQAAILAELAREVISIERHPALSAKAAARLAELAYRNVTLVVGDGTLGWPARAPLRSHHRYGHGRPMSAAAVCTALGGRNFRDPHRRARIPEPAGHRQSKWGRR